MKYERVVIQYVVMTEKRVVMMRVVIRSNNESLSTSSNGSGSNEQVIGSNKCKK